MSKKHKKISSKTQTIILAVILSLISISTFVYYYQNGLMIAYSDSQSHLNIARRTIDSLTPGLAQIGSVWLPLPHILMIPTIWSDFMWHSGLSGAIFSMISYVVTGILIFKFLEKLNVDILGRIAGVAIFALNPNILYLQSTAMTELLTLAIMMAGSYYFFLWFKERDNIMLVKSSFWIMLSTLVRYDGWFLFVTATGLLILYIWRNKGYKVAEGSFIFFCSLGGVGIVAWLLWNLVIFGNPLYFAFGSYSAHTQQLNFAINGLLATQHNIFLSTKIYVIAVMFCMGLPLLILTIFGIGVFYLNKDIENKIKFALIIFVAPLFFNIIALYLGHSILFMPNILGSGWFNVRYGVMSIFIIAIFVPNLLNFKNKYLKIIFAGIIFMAILAPFFYEPVTLQDAKEGMARKDLRTAGQSLADLVNNDNDKNEKILISASANDPIIFLSGLSMKRFIYEGSGKYWSESIDNPSKYATWVFIDKKNSMDYIATKLWKTNVLLKNFNLVYKDEWFLIYRIKGGQKVKIIK